MATENSEPLIRCHDIMERLGITKSQAQKIIEVYRSAGLNSTLFCRRYTGENVDAFVAGSRSEGTAFSSVNSDIDMLFVQRSVRCFKTFPSENDRKKYLVSFLLDFENMKGGYAMLRLVSVGHTRSNIKFLRNIIDGIVLHNGHGYLRNDRLFTSIIWKHHEGMMKQPSMFSDTTGPSNRIVFQQPFFDDFSIDRVQAFPVSYPAILDQWRKRERKYNWPSKVLIETALNQDVIVVPVGVQGSDEEILQWRLSVTLAEKALVQSFNDTQIKLFVTVKMIVKHELKPISDCMSSYVVKNVMFWVIEETEDCLFRRIFFEEILLDILKRLKRCIYWKHLQNYMFPCINMLENKIFEIERRKLVQRLDDIIANGCSSALLQSPLVNDMIHMPRHLFQEKLVFRQLAEQVTLAVVSISRFHFGKLIKDNILHKRSLCMDMGQMFCILVKHVFPIIRATNPFDFFDILISMTDEEILYRLYEGASFAS